MVIESATTGPKRWYTRIDTPGGSGRAFCWADVGPAPAGASEAFGAAAANPTLATSANHDAACGDRLVMASQEGRHRERRGPSCQSQYFSFTKRRPFNEATSS